MVGVSDSARLSYIHLFVQASRCFHVIHNHTSHLRDDLAAPLSTVDLGRFTDRKTDAGRTEQRLRSARVLAGVEVDIGAILVGVLGRGLGAERVVLGCIS